MWLNKRTGARLPAELGGNRDSLLPFPSLPTACIGPISPPRRIVVVTGCNEKRTVTVYPSSLANRLVASTYMPQPPLCVCVRVRFEI